MENGEKLSGVSAILFGRKRLMALDIETLLKKLSLR
jgi:hypothetical protein